MKKASDMGITGDMTLDQIQTILRKELSSGFICPCCNAPARMYTRTLTWGMCYGLILLYNRSDHDWVHIEEFFSTVEMGRTIRADVPKLRFWNLLEPKTGEKADGNPCNGYYRITEAGKLFVRGELGVMSHVKIYNNTFFGVPENCKMINIKEALKNKFDYDLLMKGEPGMKSLYRGPLLFISKHKDGGSSVSVWHPLLGSLKDLFDNADENNYITDVGCRKLSINDIDIKRYEQ